MRRIFVLLAAIGLYASAAEGWAVGAFSNFTQDLAQLMGNILGEARRSILFIDLWVIFADLLGTLIFLVQKFQSIGGHKIIEYIGTDKVGAWQ